MLVCSWNLILNYFFLTLLYSGDIMYYYSLFYKPLYFSYVQLVFLLILVHLDLMFVLFNLLMSWDFTLTNPPNCYILVQKWCGIIVLYDTIYYKVWSISYILQSNNELIKEYVVFIRSNTRTIKLIIFNILEMAISYF